MNQHLTAETLIDYLHGELPPQLDSEVYAHLAACNECRGARDAEAAVTELLRSRAAAEEREFPALVRAAVWSRVRNDVPSPFARLAALFRPAIAVPVAAALVAGAFLASPLSHGNPSSPSIDATYYFEAHAAQSASTPLSEHAGIPPTETSMLGDAGTSSAPPLEQYAAYAVPGGVDAVR